jgi:4-oxalocrotonate tautomerase family enzyme
MVVVQVEWLAGRTPEQKEELVAGITDISGRVGGAQHENVQVVLLDVPPSNWGRAGGLVEPSQRGPQEELTGGTAVGVEAVNGREEAPAARATLPELDGAARIFNLEQLREEGMPVFPAHRPGYSYLLHRHHEDEYEDTKPRTSASGVIICMEHTGTHIDALCKEAGDSDTLWWRARQWRTDGQGIHPARRGGDPADNRARSAAGRTGEQRRRGSGAGLRRDRRGPTKSVAKGRT